MTFDKPPSKRKSSVERENSADEWGGVPELIPEQRALVDELVADGLAVQHRFKAEPRYKTTGKGHYEADTVEEIRRARLPAASRMPPISVPEKKTGAKKGCFGDAQSISELRP